MKEILSTEAQLQSFVDDLRAAITSDVGEIRPCSNTILCGMGGSAISGDVVADCCLTRSSVQIRVHKYPELPDWVGPETLAVVSSYSGNTIETIQMYKQARERGCDVHVITSGGILEKKAREAGDHLIMLPDNLHPRHSVGYMIGYTLAIVSKAGGPDLRTEIEGFLDDLESYRRTMEDRSENGLAWGLASDYLSNVPVICTDVSMKSVALRWKTQINENAKYVAFNMSFPDSMHYCADSWVSAKRGDMLLTLLSGKDDDMCVGTRHLTEIASEMFREGVRFRYVKLMGGSTLENIFRAIILGDYVSMYMAEMRGIDSAEVKPVRQLKDKIRSIPDIAERAS